MKAIHNFFHDEHGHTKYFKVYVVLLILLLISYVGPMFGIKWLMLVTAFGIAIIKTVMVGAYFMHLNVEKRFAVYMLGTVLAFVILFFAGTAPDVMQAYGSGWTKPSWQVSVEEGDLGDPSAEAGDHGTH